MSVYKMERQMARYYEQQDKLKRSRYGQGNSKAAARRLLASARGKIHHGQPGDVIEMSRGRKYEVAEDGSFRRLAA